MIVSNLKVPTEFDFLQDSPGKNKLFALETVYTSVDSERTSGRVYFGLNM